MSTPAPSKDTPKSRFQPVEPPGPAAWAGLAFPGLGHLLTGSLLDGAGLLSLTWLTLWSVLRAPDLIGQLVLPGGNGFLIHPWLATFSILIGGLLLWREAYRYAKPPDIDIEKEKGSQARIIWKQFIKNRTGVFGLYLVLVLVYLALITPAIAPFDPDQIDVGPKLAGPSFQHLMGTDQFSRDMFSRVMYGARISLVIGFIAVSISATIGCSLGAIAGFFGGAIDKSIMWFTDLLLSLPRLIMLLAVIGFYRAAGAQSIFLIVVVLGLTGWMGVARIVRSQVLSLKEQEFIQAARALGYSDRRIIFRHLIPNALAPVIVYASLAIGSTILTEASLSFLGLGVPPPTATWGSVVNDGRDFLRSAWWITMFPGLMIVLAVMSFNLLGDGLRDALDPKLRGRN
ncbi:MAG: peptide/nickel transport system permease protein [Myxococcota bacterium]|jgi:peptide/nickel transport system permease protein